MTKLVICSYRMTEIDWEDLGRTNLEKHIHHVIEFPCHRRIRNRAEDSGLVNGPVFDGQWWVSTRIFATAHWAYVFFAESFSKTGHSKLQTSCGSKIQNPLKDEVQKDGSESSAESIYFSVSQNTCKLIGSVDFEPKRCNFTGHTALRRTVSCLDRALVRVVCCAPQLSCTVYVGQSSTKAIE